MQARLGLLPSWPTGGGWAESTPAPMECCEPLPCPTWPNRWQLIGFCTRCASPNPQQQPCLLGSCQSSQGNGGEWDEVENVLYNNNNNNVTAHAYVTIAFFLFAISFSQGPSLTNTPEPMATTVAAATAVQTIMPPFIQRE